MTRLERLQAYGKELRRRRESLEIDAKVLARRIGTSPQNLSQIERAYEREGRDPVGPGSGFLLGVAKELGWRVTDQRNLLGDIPDEELVREPVLDEVRQAGYSPEMPDETRQEILDYIRFKSQKVKGQE